MAKQSRGAPKKKDGEKKRSLTVCITGDMDKKVKKLFGSRTKAIELAVEYSDLILKTHKEKKQE